MALDPSFFKRGLFHFDGFSEIIAKSVLWGQYPVSLIKYPHVGQEPLNHPPENPNIAGREHYLATLNQYPWVQK